MTRRSLTAAMITRFGRDKYEDTRPELGFKALTVAMGGTWSRASPIRVRSTRFFSDEQTWWTITPDGQVGFPKWGVRGILAFADGPSHQTSRGRRRDRWERELLAKLGLRSIGVDYQLLVTRRWHPEVQLALAEFALSSEPWRQVFA